MLKTVDIEKIVKHINNLCDGNPFKYLQNNSNWFSMKLTSFESRDRYPYMLTQHNSFFFDSNLTPFEKDVGLKFIINTDLNDPTKDFVLISKWIIKVWGGIRGIKDETITELVQNISTQLYPFENISSWSKINSFKNIDTDIIYDSKVIYSLNWLLLQINRKSYKFFHQPNSRNSKLTIFPIDTIINYIHSDSINTNQRGDSVTNDVYQSKNEVYKNYRNTLISLNSLIWGNESLDLSKLLGRKICLKEYPFFTEMLLFNMSDDIVLKDIRKRVLVDIRYF